MKITYFHIFLSFISINELNAIEIGEQETNLCICSDFTYLNNQGLLVNFNLFLSLQNMTFCFLPFFFNRSATAWQR